MLIIGLGLVLIALLIVSIVGAIKSANSGDLWGIGIFFSCLFLVVLFLVVVLTYAGNTSRVASLRAFQDVNIQNYSIAYSETKAILSSEQFTNKIVAGSLEKTGTSQAISDRIKEWRDAVNSYNMEVAAKQKTRNLWVWPGWLVMPREVMDLKLLTIQ